MSGLIASVINKDLSLLFYGDFSLCSSDQQFYSFSSYFTAKSRWSKQTRVAIVALLTVFDLSSPVHWQPSLGHLIMKESIFLSVALSGKMS